MITRKFKVRTTGLKPGKPEVARETSLIGDDVVGWKCRMELKLPANLDVADTYTHFVSHQ